MNMTIRQLKLRIESKSGLPEKFFYLSSMRGDGEVLLETRTLKDYTILFGDMIKMHLRGCQFGKCPRELQKVHATI